MEFGLLGLFVATLLVSAVVGLMRGLNKAVIRLITLVLAALLTFALAGPITKTAVQTIQIEGVTLREWLLAGLGESEMLAGIFDAVPLMLETILAVPAFVIGIALFPVLFWLLSGATWIVFLFVQKPLRKLIFREKGDGVPIGMRFAGMGIGIVTGVLIFGMFMTPVLGLFTVLPEKDAMDELLDAMVEQEMLPQVDAVYLQEAYAVTDSAIVNVYNAIGASSAGRAYLNSVSAIEADGLKTCLTDEFNSLLAVGQTAIKGGLMNALLKSEDPNAIYTTLSDKHFMDALMQDMFDSKLLRAAIPEVMAIAMEGAANAMNVPANKEMVYDNMMDDIALAVKDADIDYAAIHAYEQTGGAPFAAARSAAIRRTGSAVMTMEEYQTEIQKLLKLADSISAILNRGMSGDNAAFTDSVANQIVNAVKAQAAENGQSVLDSFAAADVQVALSNIHVADLEAGEGDAAKLLEQLTDRDRFETDVATVETIKEVIRESVKNAVADDSQAEQTASALAGVVSNLVGAVSAATDETGGLNAANLDFEKIASAVTDLQNSTLKDVGTSVLDMVASGDLGDNAIVGNVLGAVKEGYENGEDISGTICTAGALINLGAALGNNGQGGQEAMVDSLADLINNLDEFTIRLLPEILTNDTIISMGVPAEYAQTTYDVMETLLRELMKLQGASDYENEVNSILSLYNLATSGVEKFAEDDVEKLVDYAIKSDAIFNTLVSVSTSNPFGIQIQDETTRTNLINAIEDHYAQSAQTQRERDIYYAVATLLGLDEEVKLA